MSVCPKFFENGFSTMLLNHLSRCWECPQDQLPSCFFSRTLGLKGSALQASKGVCLIKQGILLYDCNTANQYILIVLEELHFEGNQYPELCVEHSVHDLNTATL